LNVQLFGFVRVATVVVLALWGFSGHCTSDTLRLPEAVVSSVEPDGFRHVLAADSLIPMLFRSGSVGALLEKSASVDLRSYGNTSLQTLSFRGGQASHTRVLWQDLELNSPTLGLFDFGAIGAGTVDAIYALPGLSGMRADNGALGGTVLLGQHLPDSSRLGLGLFGGAFGLREVSLVADFASGKIRSTTRLAMRQMDNDFAFDNYTLQPWQRDTMANAAVSSGSVVQGLALTTGRGTWEAWLWLNGVDRALPGTLLSENIAGTRQRDNQVRGVLSHQFSSGRLEQRISVGITHDFQHYESWFESRIFTSHVQAIHRMLLAVGKKSKLRSLTRTGSEHAVSDGFQTGAERFTLAHTAGMETNWLPWFATDVHLSQRLADNGVDVLRPGGALRLKAGRWSAYLNGGSALRFPTLNDLHWLPGGNPDLRHEHSISAETGGAYDWNKQGRWFRGLRISGNVYRTDLTDLIAWVPGEGYWQAANLRSARMSGAEAEAKSDLTFRGHNLSVGGSYGYTRSVNRATRFQLAYVPLHRARLFANGCHKNWRWGVYARYMGRRSVNEAAGQFMPAHTVVDFSLERTFHLSKITGIFGLELMNALDASYQVMAYMPMPGRHANFKINIIW